MEKYYRILSEKLEKYSRKYGTHTKRAALAVIFWNIKQLLAFSPQRRGIHRPDTLRIAIEMDGGVGDHLLAANYVWYFKEFLGDLKYELELITHRLSAGTLVFKDPVTPVEKVAQVSDYDLYISIFAYLRVPVIEIANLKKIEALSPKLLDLVKKYITFSQESYLSFYNPSTGGTSAFNYAMAQGKRRIEQLDIDGILGIGPEFKAEIPLVSNEEEVLKKFDLNQPFITLFRGVDSNVKSFECTRLWPVAYYNKITTLLKEHYPEYLLVQMGDSTKRVPPMENIDVNLIGKTTMDEVKVILKNARLHIDGEGGIVHLRHALHGGQSIVVYGPTSDIYYGYPENINLRADFCHACEWAHRQWYELCLRSGNASAECLKRISPDRVFQEIQNVLNH